MRQQFTAIAATLLLAPASGMAQDAPEQTKQIPQADQAAAAPQAASDQMDPANEMGETSQIAQIAMSRAIEAAQGQIDGGVLEAEIETEDDALIYEIDMVKGADVYEVTVDAQSGEVLSQSEERLTSFLSGLFQEDELRAAEAAGDSLMQTLAELEGTDDTRIEELSLEEEDGRMVYELELTDATGAREIMLDAATGERLTDAG